MCKPERPLVVKKIIASSFHVLLEHKPDHQCLKKLFRILTDLLQDGDNTDI